MALIKCPECQQTVSDTAETCPHCGFKIQGSPLKSALAKQNTVDDKVVVLERKRDVSSGGVTAIMIVGIVLIPLLIGIIMVSVGAFAISLYKANSRNTREVLYYDKRKNKFLLVTAKDEEIMCDPEIIKRKLILNRGAVNFKGKFVGYINSDDFKNIDVVLSHINQTKTQQNISSQDKKKTNNKYIEE